MTNQPSILTEIKGPVAHVFLNRPEFHNALNAKMIQALLEQLEILDNNRSIRIIALRGMGNSFCAGADLNWMRMAQHLSEEENYRECQLLAKAFYSLYKSSKITVAFIHGNIFGGAIGLVASCDMAIASTNAVFAFSEVRMGLVPATIMPYVLNKTGNRVVERMLTGMKFKSGDAEAIGLVNAVVQDEPFESALNETLAGLLEAAPEAQGRIKLQARTLIMPAITEDLVNHTASLLAETRISKEALEGLGAFYEKRKPAWQQA